MMKVEANDLLKITTNVLTQMGINNFRDVILKDVEKKDDEWLVSFSFLQEDKWFTRHASFAVNAETGETRGMWLDRVWQK